MFTVGLDVDNQVFTVKILLYAGNFCISSPLVFITLGIIYLFSGKSARNFAANVALAMANFASQRANTPPSYNKYTNIPWITDHLFKYKTEYSREELGYFLAGLIEGNGRFYEKELHIVFQQSDYSLASFIKKKIGYGSIKKIEGIGGGDARESTKTHIKYICNNKKGLEFIVFLINGKFVTWSKYNELNLYKYDKAFNINILPPLDKEKLSLDNFWLAGFTQAIGCFYINVFNSSLYETGYSVRLEYSLVYKDKFPLELLRGVLGQGNITQDSYGIWCYKSSDIYIVARLINYYDNHHVFAGKYIKFIKFRKVYRMIREGKHLESKGIKKIISIATKGSSETRTQENLRRLS